MSFIDSALLVPENVCLETTPASLVYSAVSLYFALEFPGMNVNTFATADPSFILFPTASYNRKCNLESSSTVGGFIRNLASKTAGKYFLKESPAKKFSGCFGVNLLPSKRL